MVTSQAACWEAPKPFANIAAGDGGTFLQNAKKAPATAGRIRQ